jgi:lauroyl/myristoyl acyltransferase/mitochondrial fission protein ELM1
MKNNSTADYVACILLKIIGPVIRSLHPLAAFWVGRRLGELVFVFDIKHRAIAYANIKTAFGDKLSPGQLSRRTLGFYRNLGQNIIEIFLIPVIDKEYAKKYVTIEGLQNVADAFGRGKGVFLVSVHEGSWELSNILAAHLDIPFSMFVREQKMPRLNELLNSFRRAKGCRIIRKEDQTRELIRLIRSNESCGMSIDQGGRDGVNVKFFNKDASMAPGAVRLALKYDAALVPVFSTRLRGPYIKLMIEPPVKLVRTGDMDSDIRTNLQDMAWLYQKYLYKYPCEYLWHYRIWKYSLRRDVLILSDGKTGHLRQSQALARMVSGYLKQKGIDSNIRTVRVAIKDRLHRAMLAVSCNFAWRGVCQGCLGCLRQSLTDETYQQVSSIKADIVISCGSSVAAVNRVLSLENQARSIVIMKPVFQNIRSFDLVVMPKHDNPPAGRNVVVTRGALNLIDDQYLKDQGDELEKHSGALNKARPVIGVLYGGDSKKFSLGAELVRETAENILDAAQTIDADLLITTSRRTSAAAEKIIREGFAGQPRCKFLVIANEKNYDFAVGGILDKSDIVVISPESISMISEAASSGKYVIVFDAPGISGKHLKLLSDFEAGGLIVRAAAKELSGAIRDICYNKPPRQRLDDTAAVKEGLSRIL